MGQKRIINYDFLRGFFILLALYQHYGCYLMIWYQEFFNAKGLLGTNPSVHSPLIGTVLRADQLSYYFGSIFVPWVSQIYLTLATFNLAKRTQSKFKTVFYSKIKTFLLIFFLIVFENILVTPEIGEALSFYPLHAWMIILILISIFYRFLNVQGVMILLGFSLIKWVIPVFDLSSQFELIMKDLIHKDFMYNAKIDYFLTSACIGFLLGYSYFHRREKHKNDNLKVFLTGVVFLVVYFSIGPDYYFNTIAGYESEHGLAKSFTGILGIWGAQMVILPLFLFFEYKNIFFRFRPILFVGINSFFIFYLHRIFYIHLYMPIREFISILINQPLKNNSIEIWIAITILLSLIWLLKKKEDNSKDNELGN